MFWELPANCTDRQAEQKLASGEVVRYARRGYRFGLQGSPDSSQTY